MDQLKCRIVVPNCSTLELMRRAKTPLLSEREMKEDRQMNDQERICQFKKMSPLINSSSPITGYGEIEALEKWKQGRYNEIVHDKPIVRKLVGGRYIAPDQDAIRPNTCQSEQSSGCNERRNSIQSFQPVESTSSHILCCDNESVSTRRSKSSRLCERSQSTLDNEPNDLKRIQDEKIQLQDELYKLTRKMNRKYEERKMANQSFSGGKIKKLARMWSQPDLDNEKKYDIYMQDHYITQSNVDYYQKKQIKRTEMDHYHLKKNVHSKYGDALTKSLQSLRGRF